MKSMDHMEQKDAYSMPSVVAEIGCNHKGDMTIACELIRLAKESGADYAKFQKRHPRELLTDEQYNSPHQVPYNAYGSTYGAHREFLEFDRSQHQELKNYCASIGIAYACSVWDISSANDIISLDPDYIKIPSACNNHEELIELLLKEYTGQVHISLGMTGHEEERLLMHQLKGHEERIVLYACTSGYPVPFEDVCLLEISRLKKAYPQATIGFSGHHLGIAVDIAAYTLGAQWIERHFTKDRTWKGTDHAASLEPPGLSKLIRDLNACYKSLRYKSDDILAIEREQREKLKFRKT